MRKPLHKTKLEFLRALKVGAVYDGTISRIFPYGALVAVNGVEGLLCNEDYSIDHSCVEERYAVGDSICVRCKRVEKGGRLRIAWEAEPKYHRTTPFKFDLGVGAFAAGRVVGIRNLPQSRAAFVRLDEYKGVDVLCSVPEGMENPRGTEVIVRISSVRPGETEFAPPRVRGHILCE